MIGLASLETLTRLGFAARGLIYILIGFLALWLGRAEDGAGVLEYLSSGTGKLLLAAMALGLLAYGIWRLSEAAIDTENHGDDAKGIAIRAGGAVSGLIHLGLSFYAATLALGGGSGENPSGGGTTQEGAATTLAMPGGTLLLMLAAAALLVTGLFQFRKAATADFLKHLDQRAAGRPPVKLGGRIGYAARGVVFLVMAWFCFQAASETDAGQVTDMGEALASLPATIGTLVAAGLLVFGLFSLVEARYRRINDPHVVSRLKSAAARV